MASKERPNGYWSIARIIREARKYDFRGDFREHSSGAYSAAVDKKILDSACAHMPRRKRIPRKWPPERVISEARKFATSAAFQARSPGAYRAAVRLGIIKSVSAHMVYLRVPKGFWSEKRILAAAQKYKTRASFRKRAPHAYGAAAKYKLMDAACGHMKFVRRPDWTIDGITREAKKYSSRSEFEHGNRGAYKAAHRRNLLDVVCGHMRQRGHRYRRAIYVYEFTDRSVYVGLTYDYERRHRQHARHSKMLTEKVLLTDYRLIRRNVWMPPEDAAKAEAKEIRSYSQKGWTVINMSKPGSIGGSFRRWTPEALSLEVKKYKTLSEFQKLSRGAYHAAWKHGLLASLSASLSRQKRPNGTWTRRAVLSEARKYRTRTEFAGSAPGARNAAQRLGLMKRACAHMRLSAMPNGYWTRKLILQSAKSCSGRTDFQRRFPGAYDAAIRRRMLPSIHKLIPKKARPRFWTLERLSAEARKHSTRTAFKRGAASAYVIAGRRGVRNEICKHMI